MRSVLSPEDRARVESESLKGLQAEDFDFLTTLLGGGLKGAIRLGRLLQTAKRVTLDGSFWTKVAAPINELRPQPKTKTTKPRLIGKVPARKTAAKKKAAAGRPSRPAPEKVEETGESVARPSSRRTPRRQEKTGGNGQAKAKGEQARDKRTGGAGGRSGRPFVGPKLR